MTTTVAETSIALLPTPRLHPNPFSLSIYGDPAAETDGLLDSVRRHGVLVPLVVTPAGDDWEVLSGHRRLACAHALELDSSPARSRLPGAPPPAGASFWNTTASAARPSASKCVRPTPSNPSSPPTPADASVPI